MARKGSEVRAGQRYREVGTSFLGSRTPLWAVEGIFTSTDSLTYVRLMNVADSRMRTKRYLSQAAAAPYIPIVAQQTQPGLRDVG